MLISVLPILPIPPFEEFWVAFLGRSIGEIHCTAKGIEQARILHASSELIRHFIDDLGILSSQIFDLGKTHLH
jgi:hypothetical protein